MSQLLESDQWQEDDFQPVKADEPFVPNITHADDPPWDNKIRHPPHKPNAVHLESTHWDNRVKAEHFKPNAKFVNMFNRPTWTMPINESELVQKCRHGLDDGTIKAPMDHIRMICFSRGASGIYNLGRSLRRLASHGEKVSLNEFVKGLHEIDMGNVAEATLIFRAFEVDLTGYINMEEFFFYLRHLTKMREDIINKCFQTCDKNNDGVITIADLRRSYSVKHHPLFVNGDEGQEEILKRFLATFEEGDNLEAEITKEEFLNYYAGISAMIEDDGYFDLLLREEYNL